MIAIGNNNISGVFMGSTPIPKMYLGSVLVYGGSEPSVPNKTVRLWLTEQYEGKDYYDIYYANGVVSGVIDYVPPYMVVRVEFGDGLTRIEDNTFAAFELIEALEFPETMTSLGKGCFMNCSSLKVVYLSTSTELDGWSDETSRNRVFYGCNELTELYIKDTVTNAYEWIWKIDYVAPIHISNAEKLFDNPANITLVTYNGQSKLYEFFVINNEGGDREFFHAENGIIKSGWQPTLMSKDDIERIEIEYGVTEIGRYAFSDIPYLVLLSPINAEKIGDYAFKGCSRLMGFNQSGKLELTNEVKYIGISAFEGCSSIEKVVIGDTFSPLAKLQSIGAYAFYGCSKLNEITCSATTAPSVNSSTFFNVASGGTLNYPSGSDYSSWLSTSEHYLGYYGWVEPIKPIGEFDVRLTKTDGSVVTDTYSNGKINSFTYAYKGDITDVEIGSGVTNIMSMAFYQSTSITSLTIHNENTTIGEAAFYGTNIPEVVLKTTVYHFAANRNDINAFLKNNNITRIANFAFASNTAIGIGIKLPASVEYIGRRAFYGANIGAVDALDGNLTYIGDEAFASCTKLKYLSISSSVQTLGSGVLDNCSSLINLSWQNPSFSTIGGVISNLPIRVSCYPNAASNLDVFFTTDYFTVGSTSWDTTQIKSYLPPYSPVVVTRYYEAMYKHAEVVEQSGGIQVDLNNQWKRFEGEFYNNNGMNLATYTSDPMMTYDNAEIPMKITFNSCPDFKILVGQSAEQGFDYVTVYEMDTNYQDGLILFGGNDLPSDYNFNDYGWTYEGYRDEQYMQELDLTNDGGEHFVWVTYHKDDGGSSGQDRAIVILSDINKDDVEVINASEGSDGL